jgi:hypothetical protein
MNTAVSVRVSVEGAAGGGAGGACECDHVVGVERERGGHGVGRHASEGERQPQAMGRNGSREAEHALLGCVEAGVSGGGEEGRARSGAARRLRGEPIGVGCRDRGRSGGGDDDRSGSGRGRGSGALRGDGAEKSRRGGKRVEGGV